MEKLDFVKLNEMRNSRYTSFLKKGTADCF
jgi:hypothetical protein